MSMHDDIKTVLVSEEQLKAKVAELGAQISRDYAGKNLVLVSILKGSVVFMADLMRAVSIPCNIDFMVVSSYGGSNTTTSGLVKIIKDLDGDLSGKDVLIVEDILDTGVTLSNLVPMLKMRNPNSVKICTILDKPSRRKAAFSVLSLIGRLPRRPGKTRVPVPEYFSASRRIAAACRLSGTACSFRIFVRLAGMVQTASSKSNSVHSACRNSPGRTNTCGASRKAKYVDG